MKYFKTTVLGFLFIMIAGLLLNQYVNGRIDLKATNEDSEKHETKPREKISLEEQNVNQRRLKRSARAVTNVGSVSERRSANSSYANGQISGTWSQFRIVAPEERSYGFRVDGSVYDQTNDVIYPISSAGHLWKINGSAFDYTNAKWELINHKMVFDQSYIEGLTTISGTFRMIRSSNTGMQYSDDEGRTWTDASGISLDQSTVDGTVSKNNLDNRVFVVGNSSASTTKVFLSNDDGLSYAEMDLNFSVVSHSVKILRPSFSQSVFLFVFKNSTSKIEIYECGPDESAFSLISTPETTFNALTRVLGTYHEDQYHFYIAGGRTHIYYSDDKGANWENTNTKNDSPENSENAIPKTVHPTKPNIIYKGFTDTYVSTDYGKTFTGWKRPFGWDLQHAKMYERTDGSFFHFVGLDFGCFVSDTPETPTHYTQLNNDSPIQMCYDASHGKHLGSSFLATQDRGTFGYLNSTNNSTTTDVRTTDGLRVTLANNETSVWTWMYFGNIIRKSNFTINNSAATGLNWTDNWWAAPMIASPRPGDDAVYVAAGKKLKKFTFHPGNHEIIQTEHYFDFESVSNFNVSGFGYSPINPDLWFVSVENGDFFYSDDGGQTFEKTRSRGLFPTSESSWHKSQHVIKASHSDENRVYYAGVGNKFMISNNGGKAFSDHSNGLDVYRIRDFDFTQDEKYIFAACGGGGLWVYSIDDNTWFEMNDEPVPYVNFTDVEYIAKESTVNFSSFGSGVLRFKMDATEPELRHPKSLMAQQTEEKTISLSWIDQSDIEEGFLIERAGNGSFSQIANVPANQNSFTDAEKLSPGEYLYRVRAMNANTKSHYSNYALVQVSPAGAISKEDWKLVSVSSQQTTGYGAALAFDDNPFSMWHTAWGIDPIPGHPHTLIIDMNETLDLAGFSYLPRQDNQWNGVIKDFEFYVSPDNTNWEKAATGSWEQTKTEKEVYFDGKKKARYLKLISISETNGTNFASCAELSVFEEISEGSKLTAPQFVQAGRISDTEIELIWMDMSTDETGFEIENSIGGGFTKIETADKNETSIRIDNISPLLSNTFRIAAFNDSGNSNYSEPITLKYIKGDGVLSTPVSPDSFAIYPNPFDSELKINIAKSLSVSQWQIITISGRVLMQGNVHEECDDMIINTSQLQSGIYLIRLAGSDGWFTHRISKR